MDCTSANIVLDSQADVDAFQTNYGGGGTCDTVTGNLSIGGGPTDTQNLDGLAALTTVGGLLDIFSNSSLQNIDGLGSLVSVGGNLQLESNPLLTDLDGLASLTSVGGNLFIYSNVALENIEGLSALTSIGGDFDLQFSVSLTHVDGLASLTSIGGNLIIHLNGVLQQVDGLAGLTAVGGDLDFENNPALANVNGLSQLIGVGGNVNLVDNEALAVCGGLEALLDDVDDGAPGPGPGPAGIPDVGGDVVLSGNLPGCNSVAQVLGGPANFLVTKTFTDGNPGEVEVAISCNTGLPLEQTKIISPGDPVEFVVGDFDNGELECTITEGGETGYIASYEFGTSSSDIGCTFTEVAGGDEFECAITNTPAAVAVTITKELVIEGEAGGVDTRYELVLHCDSEIAGAQQGCGFLSSGVAGPQTSAHWCQSFYGDDSAVFTAEVIPGYPSTTCFVEEHLFDDAVEVVNGCGELTVSAGAGDACTITNTVFFEGIPTLSGNALALLALSMLGLGLVAARRLL